MSYEAVIVVFARPEQANDAVRALRRLGISASDIKRHPADAVTTQDVAPAGPAAYPHSGFWAWLFGRDVQAAERAALQRALRKGGTVLSVHVLEDVVGHVRSELNRYQPLVIDDHPEEQDLPS